MSDVDPVPSFDPDGHPLRDEALAQWEARYARQGILSNALPSPFKRFLQGYVAGHAAARAQGREAQVKAATTSAAPAPVYRERWEASCICRPPALTQEPTTWTYHLHTPRPMGLEVPVVLCRSIAWATPTCPVCSAPYRLQDRFTADVS